MTSPLTTLPVLSIQQPFIEAILAEVKSIGLSLDEGDIPRLLEDGEEKKAQKLMKLYD